MEKLTPRKILSNKGLRITKYRIAIIEEIMKGTHPSASEIFNEILIKWPKISRTTIYNTVHRLSEEGVIEELNVDSAETRYDLSTKHHHGHFFCKKCKQLTDFPITQKFGKISELSGFEITNYQIYLQGTCKACIDKENNE